MTAPARRGRRSPDEVHRLILDAATTLFSAQGLTATSTRDIAAKAGVAEPLVFRHFGSKEELFRQAVYAPLRTFFTEYTTQWRASLEAGGPPPGSTDYMSHLYDVLREHRELLTTLLAADAHRAYAFGPDTTDSPLAELLREVEELVAMEMGRNVRTSLDPALAVRFAFAMGLSMALFGDLMFPADRPLPDHDKLVEGMGDFLSYATRRATESVAPSRRRR